ncbi:hypothetical protein [uncultured Aliiroseovarius sp.]|uniref:hypothetical protein n=1 Tax=uncultured Aliiroseovarius sp. TaxID=1658783 RepID=UPI002626F247|nr:hypothetical protein [uncultured Aliiroseovarius sp.]
MPVNIYEEIGSDDGLEIKDIAFLCEDLWDLPKQIYALENWICEKGQNLPKSNYVADVGFSIRSNASGGGATVSPNTLGVMGRIGMALYLSEYNQ